jgi:molecular chaperone GrpE
MVEGEAMNDESQTSETTETPAEVASQEAPVDALAAAQAEAAKFKDQLLRAAAELDNVRKRGRREAEDARRAGREEILRDLLPVFDNLERAMTSAQKADDVKAVAEGLGMVQRQFLDTLGRVGITRVPGVGSPFDPTMHEAIQQVVSAEHAPGTILAEVQPGYMQGDRLVRAAMVVVSTAPPVSA